ncbi:MAG: hypothetical protein KGN01_05530 [Patescibacteria group bacterium]|nr:hypothetical protein [Patescibacteria group bacterium]
MTHRAFARNAASSRAIPFSKMVKMVQYNPFIPIKWGAEQKGMQTGDDLSAEQEDICLNNWLEARDKAVELATDMHETGLHKSICNRLLEPFSWITVIVTATEFANFFRLRCHEHAEIHIQKIAYMWRDAIRQSKPTPLGVGAWHLPFIKQEDGALPLEILAQISTARSARVSYLTHDGTRDIAKDLDLFTKLIEGSGFGHYSPHEHIAQANADPYVYSGPFRGWDQFRKRFVLENLTTPLHYKGDV